MKDIAEKIKEGKIGVIPTDTIYGLIASAFDERAIERLYIVKKRDTEKPSIILISSIDDLEFFGVKMSLSEKSMVSQLWPGKFSIVFSCTNKKLHYLHRGTGSLAFRCPDDKKLHRLLTLCGPLVAPSANPEDLPPATSIEEAKEYFGGSIDFYLSGDIKENDPSTLVAIKKGEIVVLRSGSGKLKSN